MHYNAAQPVLAQFNRAEQGNRPERHVGGGEQHPVLQPRVLHQSLRQSLHQRLCPLHLRQVPKSHLLFVG